MAVVLNANAEQNNGSTRDLLVATGAALAASLGCWIVMALLTSGMRRRMSGPFGSASDIDIAPPQDSDYLLWR